LKDVLKISYDQNKIEEYIDCAFKFGILREKCIPNLNDHPDINELSQIASFNNLMGKYDSAQN
jgi:hypothetical protein